MKGPFLYLRLAWDGLRKNRQLSLPYLLTCVGMVAVHYILAYLASPATIDKLPRGSQTIETIMVLGCLVILLFSFIFLFYTYSFLNRRRAKEFGLYNVLGMGKRNLGRIVLWENLLVTAVALAGGLFLGASLSKLAELGLVNLMGGEIDYRIQLNYKAVFRTVMCYLPVFALNAFASLIRTRRSSAVNLLKAENAGEKPPRGNFFLALAGLGILGLAYWMALSVENPLDALMWFFAAVLLVIIATYMLFIAGSVWLCRVLQNNKRYYYHPDHFVSVSSMAYRMKRNGAGLASICIIATMVLVTLSTTSCMMAGIEESIKDQSPREINLRVWLDDSSQLTDENLNQIRSAVTEFTSGRSVDVKNLLDYRFLHLTGSLTDSEIQCSYESASWNGSMGDLRDVCLIPASDYTRMTGTTAELQPDEALLFLSHCAYNNDELTIAMGEMKTTFRILSIEADSQFSGSQLPGSYMNAPAMTLVVSDLTSAMSFFEEEMNTTQQLYTLEWRYGFDTGLDDTLNAEFEYELSKHLDELFPEAAGSNWRHIMVSSRANNATDARASYGGLFFIGIMLSIVFLLAAVLIIYYKQVSEGYEDVKRFEIMQKVGMTKSDIRRSINSQLLTVFMLPLGFAGLHLAFAFPMIRKMLFLFGLTNIALFIRTTLISLAVFALFYWIVYRRTSGVYYSIVSGRDHTPLN